MALVYVASPYKALQTSDAQRASLAKSIASFECAKILRDTQGFTPVSPILNFNGVLREDKDRQKALQMGLELLKACEYIYFSTHKDAKNSKGMQAEAKLAKELGIKELQFELDFTGK